MRSPGYQFLNGREHKGTPQRHPPSMDFSGKTSGYLLVLSLVSPWVSCKISSSFNPILSRNFCEGVMRFSFDKNKQPCC
jgi:hypothetical protein